MDSGLSRTGSRVMYPPIQCLSYDGEGSWRTFALKFSLVANHMELSDDEKKEQMLFCLRGKAADYYASIWDMMFGEIVFNVEHRFSDIHGIDSQKAVLLKSFEDVDKVADHLESSHCVSQPFVKNVTAVYKNSKPIEPVTNDSKMDTLLKELKTLLEKMSPDNVNDPSCSSNPRKSSHQSRVICYACGQRGHFAKHCFVTKFRRKLLPGSCDKWTDVQLISEAQARRIDCGV